jgi:hypothetical protein
MVADDDIVAAVASVDLLQVDAVRTFEHADLVAAEPTPIDRGVLADL